ncbi:hypothetical protein CIK05_07765 [Bdellovibrio sp. qaytius]|nr:hypothetical protein CIK05_07765 [Bdellovibrio sp. qaytius]
MLLLLLSIKCFAYDQELADRLKEELTHEANRRRAYTQFEEEKKLSEKEQNKGLALWLEEQEQWDQAREKAVSEVKKNRPRARKAIVDSQGQAQEVSKEYYDDLEEKQKALRVVEDGRKQHVQIKKEIIAQYAPTDVTSEEQELNIYTKRPRYDLRKRGRNKWSKSGAAGNPGGPSGAVNNGGFQNDNFDFPPPPPPADYNSVPQDNFDDFPPPPPPVQDFGNAPGTYDSGFGDAPIPPPPPPPPEGGWDF